jgi:hypothetical protein
MSGIGWGGPVHDQREKTLVFPHESHRMLPPGLVQRSRKAVLPRWGFSHLGRQTEYEKILRPRHQSRIKSTPIKSGQRYLCAGRYLLNLTLRDTHSPLSKFPWLVISSHFLGRRSHLSGSKNSCEIVPKKGNISKLFCGDGKQKKP